jgi:hypothetical protein
VTVEGIELLNIGSPIRIEAALDLIGAGCLANPANFKTRQNWMRKFHAALHCGMAKFPWRHAILSRRFELG